MSESNPQVNDAVWYAYPGTPGTLQNGYYRAATITHVYTQHGSHACASQRQRQRRASRRQLQRLGRGPLGATAAPQAAAQAPAAA